MAAVERASFGRASGEETEPARMSPRESCFEMPSVPCSLGDQPALHGKPRFVLKGGGDESHDGTPPHSSLVAMHVRAQAVPKSRPGLAEQSPVRPLMSFELKLTSSPEQLSSPRESTPMQQRSVNVGDDGNTPRRVRLITPRPNHQLFGRIYFDERYQRDVRESENAENFEPVLFDAHSLSAAADPPSPPPLRPVAKRPVTPLAPSAARADSAAQRVPNEGHDSLTAREMEPAVPPPAPCPAVSRDLGTENHLDKHAEGAVPPRCTTPGLCVDPESIAHPGDDVEVFFANHAGSHGAWYSGVLRARRRCDGAYGVLFGGTADWQPWAEWILMSEVTEGRLRRKDLATVRAESVPLKLKLKLQNRRPDHGDQHNCGSAQQKQKRSRARPNQRVKLTVGGKRKRRRTDKTSTPAGSGELGGVVQEAAVDEHIVAQLVAMGFDRDAGERAAMMTNSTSLVAAADFLLGGSTRRGRAASGSMREA